MLLDNVAHFNDLSPEFRQKLEDRVKGFGKSVRYKFEISHENPDPTFHNGKVVWPFLYTLDPAVFRITDNAESRKDKSKSKQIALIEGVNDKGLPDRFRKVKVRERHQGILHLYLENPEEFDMAMYLEIHPKNKSGLYPDPTKHQVFDRVDEKAFAESKRSERTVKRKAINVATELTDKEIVQFADALIWDSSEEVSVLRNKIEELAETDPVFFNDLVEGKTVEYRATVKQALDRQLIMFDPAEWKFIWASNKQPITVVSPAGDKTHVEKMADWLQLGGQRATDIYKKIKELIK